MQPTSALTTVNLSLVLKQFSSTDFNIYKSPWHWYVRWWLRFYSSPWWVDVTKLTGDVDLPKEPALVIGTNGETIIIIIIKICSAHISTLLGAQGCCYKVIEQRSWSDARDECVRIKGAMAVPNNLEENAYIRSLRTNHIWINCNDLETEGKP